MYKIAENTELLKKARQVCSADMKSVEKILKDEYEISSQISLVGSAKRKLITYNGRDKNFDFDYNLTVYDGMEYDSFYLKDTVRRAFNEVMRNAGLKDVDDSTSSLTSKPMFFRNDPTQTSFHTDLVIITEQYGYVHRLIHDKRKNVMYWNIAAKKSSLKYKEDILKESYWNEVRNTYVKKKNLHINDKKHHPSFNCYIEAVNEIFYKYF